MYGPIHLNVSSVATHRPFWVDLLGAECSAPLLGAPSPTVAFPNVSLILAEQMPIGGTKGTTVNHIAFGVPDVRAMVDRTKAAGYPIVTRAEMPARFEVKDDLGFVPSLDTHVAFTMGPDDIKVEFIEVAAASYPIALHHIHCFCPAAEEMRAWYARMFDVETAERGPFLAVDLPGGVNLTFSPTPDPVAPTRGRVLDRIGLRVPDVGGLCRRLEAERVSLDAPFDGASAVFVDPWGMSIELTMM